MGIRHTLGVVRHCLAAKILPVVSRQTRSSRCNLQVGDVSRYGLYFFSEPGSCKVCNIVEKNVDSMDVYSSHEAGKHGCTQQCHLLVAIATAPKISFVNTERVVTASAPIDY